MVIKNIWMRFLIIILLIGVFGCSWKRSELKPPLAQKESKEQIPPSQTITLNHTSQDSKSQVLPDTQKPTPPTAPQAVQKPLTAQTAPTTSPPSMKPPEPPKAPGVVFSFDNADIYEVIRVMAEIMKINYIIDPRVKGVVNIRTTGQISIDEVFPIFQSILKLNGAIAVKKDNLYEIVPFGDAKKLYVPPTERVEPGKPLLEGKYMIQIVPLKYIPVTEISKVLKPFLSDGADIVEHPPHNILILGDLASNVRKALDIISLFDLDIFTDLRVRIYPIYNSDVTEIAKEMERIFSSFEVSVKSGRGVGITFTPISRINSLLVVSSIPNIFQKVEGWLKELDKAPGEGTKLGVYVYYVQNAKAKDLADVLKEIFMKVKEKKPEKPVTPTEKYPPGVKPIPTPSPPTTTPTPKEEAAAVPEGEISIVVDETNNALVIKAYERDYRNILETIKKLDIYPKQVLIEVLLAEITLDDTHKFGIEWARFIDTLSHGRYSGTITFGVEPTGTSPGVGVLRYQIFEEAGRLAAAIKVAATDNRLRVISSPHILASNNKEAKIQIGVSQPVLTTTYTTTATSTTNVVEGTIEYKDVGIILSVTPRISDGGLVSMEITIEDSSVETTSLGTLANIPYFKKKTAKTTLSVIEGQMIVIGGLIETTKKRDKSGLPYLSRIPILGGLFGSQDYQDKRTELILLMVPHIITDQIQSKSVTQEFKDKLEGIKKELKKWEEKK
ncbi:MAG: type II secretion system secretin GspD [Thermodesulfobacteriota bacterium]